MLVQTGEGRNVDLAVAFLIEMAIEQVHIDPVVLSLTQTVYWEDFQSP